MEQLISAGADSTPIDVDMNNFMKEVIEGSSERPIVVQFWAPWCGPCKQLGPVLKKVVDAANGKVKMVRINIDDNQQIAQQMRVQSVPTVYGFSNGQPIDAFSGAQPESAVKQFVQKLVNSVTTGPDIAEMVTVANALLESQDYEAAMSKFHEIMSEDPESPEGLSGVIRSMVGLKDLEGAREIVDQLDDEFRQKPKMTLAVDALALSEKASKAAGGMDQARALIAANPNDLAARQDLALALFAIDEKAESMSQLLESIRIDRLWNDEAARAQLLEFFKTLGPANPDVIAARRELSALLFS